MAMKPRSRTATKDSSGASTNRRAGTAGAKSKGKLPTPPDRPQPYESLRDAILANEILPGTALVESTLATWFSVSRTPIREALTRLEQDGLLARIRGRLVVRERSPDEILDIYETRALLEAAVARFAAERRTSHDIRLLQRSIDRWDSIDRGDQNAMLEANREFHMTIWRAGHNESLIDLLRRLDLHIARFPVSTLSYEGRWEQAGKEHAALVRAIELRDGNTASEIAREHFQHARDIRLRLWDATS